MQEGEGVVGCDDALQGVGGGGHSLGDGDGEPVLRRGVVRVCAGEVYLPVVHEEEGAGEAVEPLGDVVDVLGEDVVVEAWDSAVVGRVAEGFDVLPVGGAGGCSLGGEGEGALAGGELGEVEE